MLIDTKRHVRREKGNGLNDPKEDNDVLTAVVNADNYVWMVVDTYVSRVCMPDVLVDEWQDFTEIKFGNMSLLRSIGTDCA